MGPWVHPTHFPLVEVIYGGGKMLSWIFDELDLYALEFMQEPTLKV